MKQSVQGWELNRQFRLTWCNHCWCKEGCSLWTWIASYILSWKLVEAWSKTWKQSDEHEARQCSEFCRSLKRVVYMSACAGCNACYVGETIRHFSTLVKEQLASDRASHIWINWGWQKFPSKHVLLTQTFCRFLEILYWSSTIKTLWKHLSPFSGFH